MVLESLFSLKTAEVHPQRLFFLGILHAAIGTFLGLWIFKNQASLVLVFLTVMASLPFMYRTIKHEEKIDSQNIKEAKLLKHHSRILMSFMFLFFGFVIAFSLGYVLLPEKLVQSTFSSQIETIRSINSNVAGSIVPPLVEKPIVSGDLPNSSSIFLQIFSNNLKVMLFSLFFSFFYGAGAIFILTWNASVIAVAIGTFFRAEIAALAVKSGLVKIAAYFGIFTLGILKYIIHGPVEILAYFTAGLAGGIISVAVIRHDFDSQSFRKILLDSVDLVMIAIFLIFIAALLEVYVTPAIF